MATIPSDRNLILMNQLQSVNNAAQNVAASLNGFIAASATLQANEDLLIAYPVDAPAYITYLTDLQTAIGTAMGGLPATPPALNS
jgi:hypothetical protein